MARLFSMLVILLVWWPANAGALQPYANDSIELAVWTPAVTNSRANSACEEVYKFRDSYSESFWPEDLLRLAAIEDELGCGIDQENSNYRGPAFQGNPYLIPARFRGYRAPRTNYNRSYSYNRSRSSYNRSSSMSRARSGRAKSFRPQRIRTPVRSIRSPARSIRGTGARASNRIKKPIKSTSRAGNSSRRALSKGRLAGNKNYRRSSAPKGLKRPVRASKVRTSFNRVKRGVRKNTKSASSTRRFNKRSAQKASKARISSQKKARNNSRRLARANRSLRSSARGARLSGANFNRTRGIKPGLTSKTFKGRNKSAKPNAKRLARKGLVGRNGTRANLRHRLSSKHAVAKRRATNKAKGRPASCSFHGDTLVLTRDGFEPIKSLEVGFDDVWARDEKTGETAWKRIIGHTSDPYEETVYVSITNDETSATQTIRSNRSHPFYVEGEDWVRAENLKVGQSLINHDGDTSTVTMLAIEQVPLQAYNITVQGFHSYFVKGDESADKVEAVWVHNSKICPLPPKLSKKEVGKLNAIKSTANRRAPKGVTNKQKRINGVHDRRSVIRMGRAFVGSNPRVLNTRGGSKMLISRDGKRRFRYPEKKKSSGRRASKTNYQANFEYGTLDTKGEFFSQKNVHVDVKRR